MLKRMKPVVLSVRLKFVFASSVSPEESRRAVGVIVLSQIQAARAGQVRIGNAGVLNHRLDAGIDAVRGNHVVGERLAIPRIRACELVLRTGQRVVNRRIRRRRAQIAETHGFGGHVDQPLGELRLPRAFVAQEVEPLVFFDRAADRAAELVVDQLRFRLRAVAEVRVRLEVLVHVVLEGRAVDVVGARFDLQVDRRAAASPCSHRTSWSPRSPSRSIPAAGL